MDQVRQIIGYENGELDASDTLALFSDLVKSGLAWSLQGHYGRMASAMIQNGYLSSTGQVLKEIE